MTQAEENLIWHVKKQTGRLFTKREVFFLSKCLIWDYIESIQKEIHVDFSRLYK